ncbi:YqjF family protein [Geodermatophilus sp. URMC 64]
MAEPVRAEPPDDVRPVLLRQTWRDVAFLHWPLDPARAAPLLPPGTEPDVLDGVTYAGLVALRIVRTAPARGPAVPYLGSFDEVNVRLYSVDSRGRRGVVFLRMDAGRLLPVLAARALPRLPYVWSATRVRRDGDRYTVAAGPRRLGLRIGDPLTPGPLEHFLTARWALHTRVAGRTVRVPLAHPPWRLHAAELTESAGDPLAGLLPAGGDPVGVLYSPGVDDVRLGPPGGG